METGLAPVPSVSRRLLVLAGAIGAGLLAQWSLAARLEAIQALSQHDVLTARLELAGLFKLCAVLVFGATALTGVSIALSSWHGLVVATFPPPGIWSWGSRQRLSGPRAQRIARVGLVLGTLLLVLSLAGGGLVWFMAERLVRCRAGVTS